MSVAAFTLNCHWNWCSAVQSLHTFSYNNVLSFSLWTTVPTPSPPKIQKRSTSNGFYCYSWRAFESTDTISFFLISFFFFKFENCSEQFVWNSFACPKLIIWWCLNSNSIEKCSNSKNSVIIGYVSGHHEIHNRWITTNSSVYFKITKKNATKITIDSFGWRLKLDQTVALQFYSLSLSYTHIFIDTI